MKATTHRSTTWQQIRGQCGRLAKRLRLNRAQQATRIAAFITGCQRSGTKMLLKTLDQSPLIWTHDHRHRDLAYGWRQDPAYQISSARTLARLVPITKLKELIHRAQAPVMAFHSLADSQISDQILAAIPEARAIWIYRHYADVAQSAVHLWGHHQLDLIRRFHERQFEQLKWRGENISPEVFSQLDNCFRTDLTPQEGGALLWYTRNQFYFHCRLADSGRTLLVKYEDLVTRPKEFFPEIFQFLGVPFETAFVNHIFSSSVRKQPLPSYEPKVQALCESLLEKLDSVYLGRYSKGSKPNQLNAN